MRFFNLLLVILFISTVGWSFTPSDTITSPEIWSGIVDITGDVIIHAKVTIEPGTEIRFATTNDNIINGDATHICLIIRSGGALYAVGTESDSIRFTTAGPKVPDSWGEIDLEEGLDAANTIFRYCVFEYGQNALDFRSTNHEVVQVEGDIYIEHCHIHQMSRSGIYVTSGGCPKISYSRIHDMPSAGIFIHGGEIVDINYTYIYNVSVGIINAGMKNWFQKCNCDHITIFNVDASRATIVKWWTGYGIYCCNSTGRLKLKNSILANLDPQYPAVKLDTWYFITGYNCWWDYGYEAIEGGRDIASTSIEADPLFNNPAQYDLSLKSNSPCIGKAQDGSTIGAWQPGTGIQAPYVVSPARQNKGFSQLGNGQLLFNLLTNSQTRTYSLLGQRLINKSFSPNRSYSGIYLLLLPESPEPAQNNCTKFVVIQ